MSPGDSNLDYITHFIVQTSDNGLTWDTLLENGTNVVKVCILFKASDNSLTWDTLLEYGANVVKVCIFFKPRTMD